MKFHRKLPTSQKFVLLVCLTIVFGAGCLNTPSSETRPTMGQEQPNRINFNQKIPNIMQLTSPAFKNNEELPVKFTCDGAGLHPPLEFKDAPSDTQSFVLILEDPDAPSGTFDHWIVFNIPAQTTNLTDSPGLSGKNSSGRTGYVGACPPSGQHRYIFHLYAVDTMLNLKAGASRQEIEQAMSGHILGLAELQSVYQR